MKQKTYYLLLIAAFGFISQYHNTYWLPLAGKTHNSNRFEFEYKLGEVEHKIKQQSKNIKIANALIVSEEKKITREDIAKAYAFEDEVSLLNDLYLQYHDIGVEFIVNSRNILEQDNNNLLLTKVFKFSTDYSIPKELELELPKVKELQEKLLDSHAKTEKAKVDLAQGFKPEDNLTEEEKVEKTIRQVNGLIGSIYTKSTIMEKLKELDELGQLKAAQLRLLNGYEKLTDNYNQMRMAEKSFKDGVSMVILLISVVLSMRVIRIDDYADSK